MAGRWVLNCVPNLFMVMNLDIISPYYGGFLRALNMCNDGYLWYLECWKIPWFASQSWPAIRFVWSSPSFIQATWQQSYIKSNSVNRNLAPGVSVTTFWNYFHTKPLVTPHKIFWLWSANLLTRKSLQHIKGCVADDHLHVFWIYSLK